MNIKYNIIILIWKNIRNFFEKNENHKNNWIIHTDPHLKAGFAEPHQTTNCDVIFEWVLRSSSVHHPCDDVAAYDGAEDYPWVVHGVHLPTTGGWQVYLSVRVQCPDSPSWSRPVWRSDQKCSTLHYPRFESRPWNTCRCMPGVPFCLSDQGFLWEVRCMQSPVATCQSLKVFFRMEKSEREREAPQRRRWYLMRWKKYRRNFNWGNVHKWRHNYYFYLLWWSSAGMSSWWPAVTFFIPYITQNYSINCMNLLYFLAIMLKLV